MSEATALRIPRFTEEQLERCIEAGLLEVQDGVLLLKLSGAASQLFPKGAGHMLAGDIDFDANDMRVLFYSGSITTTWEFVGDLTGASIIARSGALGGKTTTDGVFDANDITVSAVSGSAFTHVILFKHTGSDATANLIAVFDIASFTPTGADVNVVFNASGLFSIA